MRFCNGIVGRRREVRLESGFLEALEGAWPVNLEMSSTGIGVFEWRCKGRVGAVDNTICSCHDWLVEKR